MKTKKFYPQLSEELVSETMQTLDASAYPAPILNKKIQIEKKELKNRIIGMLILAPVVIILGIILIINVFQPGFFAFRYIGYSVIISLFFIIFAVSLLLAPIFIQIKHPKFMRLPIA